MKKEKQLENRQSKKKESGTTSPVFEKGPSTGSMGKGTMPIVSTTKPNFGKLQRKKYVPPFKV
jgi:hypothetical protein